jgi:acyl-coenzyme A thioesterase PaaI-like protein
MTALFTDAMTLRQVDPDVYPGVYEGELDKHWTIGPKVHGGAMLALCANAARTACRGPSAALEPVLQPVTVQLTTFLRGLPADGWLRIIATCMEIGHDWFDEDRIVVDSLGRLVVQARQLAMVPPPR